MKDVCCNMIYGLVDPRTGLVFYIGQSIVGIKRARAHTRPCESNDQKKAVIAEIVELGLEPEIAVLEIVNLPDESSMNPYWKNEGRNPTALHESERWWIALGRAFGWPLTNLTEGGQGRRGFVPSAETRARISAARIGHAVSQETREILRTKNRLYRHTDEAKAKISIALSGRRLSDAIRANMRAGWIKRKAASDA